tara:strand:- start:990 stop:1424 length:435 start_codon:yes stop_codon:yes gene_type:complete
MGKYKKHKKPGIYYCNCSKKLANSESIDFLQKESLRINKKIVRLCLHNNESSELMSMLILVRDFYIFPPHRHDWKDESYTVVRGSMEYQEFETNGELIFSQQLKEGDTILNNSRGFHTINPKEKILCFIENTIGPFLDKPIEFL